MMEVTIFSLAIYHEQSSVWCEFGVSECVVDGTIVRIGMS